MRLLLFLLFAFKLFAISIIDRPIVFDEQRVALTQEYIKKRYALDVDDINIIPKIIVVHWTAIDELDKSFEYFYDPILSTDRCDINKVSCLNVSAHFLVDKDGSIYRLMKETLMARHVIGLNYYAIGIENVGGKNATDDLTPAQLEANIKLISYLQEKYSTLEYLIGHYEYTQFTDHPLWLENDKNYRTLKHDPGEGFMHKLRQYFPEFKSAEAQP